MSSFKIPLISDFFRPNSKHYLVYKIKIEMNRIFVIIGLTSYYFLLVLIIELDVFKL